MKNLVFFCIAVMVSVTVFCQNDFIITINNESHQISLDETNEFEINGEKVNILVKEKDTLMYHDSFYDFKYIKKHSISKTVIEEGIEQIMMMTASGSGILVQKYDSFDPTMLQEMMLNEVTKESVSYGYSIERQDYDKTLISGEKIKVLKAALEYKGELETYEISAFGRKDEGILIMTMNMNDAMDMDGADMIKLMWDTLRIK